MAEAYGPSDAFFHVCDVADPFVEDDYFNIAHCHSVLRHVPDTTGVLAEVKRVLTPGGIIGCREMICGPSFTHPDFGVVRRAWDIFEDLLAAADGHPQKGKDLKTHLVEAGFASISAAASFDIYSSPQDVEHICRLADKWFLSPETMEVAIQYCAATRSPCDRIGAAYERWSEHPGAIAGVALGEALANKP